MRPSMISRSGRAASQLCTACRNEAIRTSSKNFPAPASFALALKATRPTSTQQQPQSKAISRRWITTWRSTSSSSSAATAAESSSNQTPKQNKTPPYYALFPQTLPDGAPPNGPFKIDLRSLKREFLRLQAASHPDFHHSGGSSQSEAELAARRNAEKASAIINAAYKTLSSPLLRAQYLLSELYGINLADDESGSQSGGGATDPELLMTVLEAREVIEEAEREEDLEELRGVNEGRIEEAEERISEALKAGDIDAAREETVRLRYWVNIRDGIQNWEKGRGVVLHH
ncbi:HSCB C-terminal oligomerization domain-containing protein [Rhypophila decipiens]|uniref:HSCB C-terminal oligomerization domain-containing protein n=1 Tax=Rhypophila decipiens TaxID=261697 RepID=A0AAN6Y2M9_9PEZI|nr:HSCB C-terminal oligomerization domain-containing protein [Rhypophila decipiens]